MLGCIAFESKLTHFHHGPLVGRLLPIRTQNTGRSPPQRVELFPGESLKLFWAASMVQLSKNNVYFQLTFGHFIPFLIKQRPIYQETFPNALIPHGIIYFWLYFKPREIVLSVIRVFYSTITDWRLKYNFFFFFKEKEFNTKCILCKYSFHSVFTFLAWCTLIIELLDLIALPWCIEKKKNLFFSGIILQNLPPQCLTAKTTDFKLMGKEFTKPLLVHTNIYI